MNEDRVTVTVAGEEYLVWPATAAFIERVIADDHIRS